MTEQGENLQSESAQAQPTYKRLGSPLAYNIYCDGRWVAGVRCSTPERAWDEAMGYAFGYAEEGETEIVACHAAPEPTDT